MQSERFFRALFPQHFAGQQGQPHQHQSKRRKYCHDSDEDDLEAESGVEVGEYGEAENNQLRLQLRQSKSSFELRTELSTRALARRMMAEKITIDPDGDLLLIVRERERKLGDGETDRSGVAGEQALVTVDDSAISVTGVAEQNRFENGDEVQDQDEEEESSEDGEAAQRKEPKEIHMLVSSKHMALVSPVFKTMLHRRSFRDRVSLKTPTKSELPLPDDDPAALRILVDIIHSRHKHVPKRVSLDLMTHISILVDKYRVHDAVQVYSEMWISELQDELPDTEFDRITDVVLQWLCIAWVFNVERPFEAMTLLLAASGEDSAENILRDSAWGILPIPKSVLSAVEKSRQDALGYAMQVLEMQIDRYKSPKTEDGTVCIACPRKMQHSDVLIHVHRRRCDAMVLGCLIKEALVAELFPLPREPYEGWSLDKVRDRFEGLEISNLCDTMEETGKGKSKRVERERDTERERSGDGSAGVEGDGNHVSGLELLGLLNECCRTGLELKDFK